MACKYCGGKGIISRPINQERYDRAFDRLYDSGQFSAHEAHSKLSYSEPHESVPCPYCAITNYLCENGPSTMRVLMQNLKMSESELLKTVLELINCNKVNTVTLLEMLENNLPGCELHIRLTTDHEKRRAEKNKAGSA